MGVNGEELRSSPKQLARFSGDRIFGTFVALWCIGLVYHLKVDVSLLWFERTLLKSRTGGSISGDEGWPQPGPHRTMQTLWIPGVASFLYFTLMIHGPKFMKTRERPTWLKPVVFCWNILLSAFSSWGAWRTISVLHRNAFVDGWNGVHQDKGMTAREIICLAPLLDNGRTCAGREGLGCVWLMLFCMSKIPEMLDTVWIICAKKDVIFLHWFHHSSVMWFCWLAWGNGVPMGYPFACMNLIVHSLMYMWYALAAANNWLGKGLKPTHVFSQTVTVLQIVQMVAGVALTVYTWKELHFPNGKEPCQNTDYIIHCAFAMYSVYLLLFCHFFYRAYCTGSKKQKPDKKNM